MSTYYAVVTYWDVDEARNRKELVLLYAERFDDAASQLELYYGNDLLAVNIHYRNPDVYGSLWHFSTDVMSELELD